MKQTKRSSAADSRSAFTVGVADLEALVFISGPCSALPNHCSRRQIPSGVVYRPEVEARDGSERLYSKYNLALFEVLDKDSSSETQGVEEHDEGPAAAVLKRRRRQQQRQASEAGSQKRVVKAVAKSDAAEVEDTSDEHYRKLHRKPEYMERRVRNREIELYQYAQWQEGQRMGSERWRHLGSSSHHHLAPHQQLRHDGSSDAGGSDAAVTTQPQSRCASPLTPSCKPNNGNNRVAAGSGVKSEEAADPGDSTTLINETLRRLGVMRTSDSATARKRFKSGMRNELKALLDSSGYQDARARSTANNNNDDSGSNGGKELPSLPQVAYVSNAAGVAPVVSADVAAAVTENVAMQQLLSEAERRVAHLGGSILEQLLIQAARLPPLAEDGASGDDDDGGDDEASEGEAEEEDRASDEDQSAHSDEGLEDDVDSNSDSLEEDVGDSSCCPREFELPQRLFGHMTRQREQER
ncbi:hypothetical protein GGI20_000598 [Coemansia sp. BCRC 34301]|nr:hypothetical protein GGI20_000598 [Coemansia sp. BCRC 34301]